MGKIGDLWVRLGLKKEGFDKGVSEAKGKLSGFGSSFGKIKTMAAGVWAAVGVGAVAAASQFVQSSQKFGDAWGRVTSQMTAAWGTFLSSLTNWDWEGFGQRIKSAMAGAKAAYNAGDAAFEVENSIALRKSAVSEELELLREQMRNQKLSLAEREAAGKKYLETVKGFYDEEAALRKEQSIAQQNAYLGRAGLEGTARNREELRVFLTSIAPDPVAVNALYKGYKRGERSIPQQLAALYQGTNDKDVKKVVDAMTASNYASSAFTAENQRITTMMNSLGAQIDKAAGEVLEAPVAKMETERVKKVMQSWSGDMDKFFASGEADIFKSLAEGVKDDADMLDDAMDELVDAMRLEDLPSPQDWAANFAEYAQWIDNMARATESANQRVKDAVVSGLSDSLGVLADGITGVQSIDAAQVFGALVSPLADAVTTIGELIMTEGLAMVAFRKSWSNPYAAIATGAALIAIGQLASSGIQKAINGSGSSSAVSGSTSAGGDGTAWNGELTIYVKGDIQGDTIAIAGRRAEESWKR